MGVEEISNVGVGDFRPTNVGVGVKVSVGVTGVTVGIGVYVFVEVNREVGVSDEFRDRPPNEQEEDRKTPRSTISIFFMGAQGLE